MMRRLLATMSVLALAATAAPAASAQGSFVPGYTDIGPTVGLGGIGEAGLSIGGRFERAIKTLPSMGDGILGIMASFDYYSYDYLFASWTYMPIGVTANYHFKLENSKLDPFIGLGLGYEVVSCDFPGSGIDPCEDSAIYFIGRAGARYFWRPNMALYGDLGAGAATINLGIMFKLRG
jgi:hypothetical protein